MLVAVKRYNGNTKDLIDYINDLEKRVKALENGPQAAFTTIGRQGLVVNDSGQIILNGVNSKMVLSTTITPEIKAHYLGTGSNISDDDPIIVFNPGGDGSYFYEVVLFNPANDISSLARGWVDSALGVHELEQLTRDLDTGNVAVTVSSSGGVFSSFADVHFFHGDQFQSFANANFFFHIVEFLEGISVTGDIRVGNGGQIVGSLVDFGHDTTSNVNIGSTPGLILQSDAQRIWRNGRAFKLHLNVQVNVNTVGALVQIQIKQGTNGTVLWPAQTVLTPANTGIQLLSAEFVFVNTSGTDINPDFINVLLNTNGANLVSTTCTATAPAFFTVHDFDIASPYGWAASMA